MKEEERKGKLLNEDGIPNHSRCGREIRTEDSLAEGFGLCMTCRIPRRLSDIPSAHKESGSTALPETGQQLI
ncbi:MAG: hypothetical protein COT91_00320 [Candidatus Doudnabacteria bacterium CG10_big_fil_rev_8_21_14_0_10_41_10]|uniref:Uncharacterized protein n=1 Tax=Candidatus Doudnabacteria bacterium CG10_big_fil_rev_8_21_14_0_10_41_10 TaxID=1974551 RepID=A0A2H0VEW4_9BACT|nr:MAG: hypothetical protein COT91_00320 [Candidatus Doudnabacteria bacterium CG10_big_fil_rev_8_21_14_0_10_41_10]